MTINAKGVEVGDFVKINCNIYGNFTIGNFYEVVEVGEGWAGLLDDDGVDDGLIKGGSSGWCFSNSEFDDICKKFEEKYKTEQWQRMTLDEVKSVEVGQRIRVNGVETVVTGLYDREEDDYGFNIEDNVDTGLYTPVVANRELDDPNNIFEKLSVEPSQPQSSDLDDAIAVFLEALKEPLKDLLSSAKEQL